MAVCSGLAPRVLEVADQVRFTAAVAAAALTEATDATVTEVEATTAAAAVTEDEAAAAAEITGEPRVLEAVAAM